MRDIQVTGTEALDLLMIVAHKLDLITFDYGLELFLASPVSQTDTFLELLMRLMLSGVFTTEQGITLARACYDRVGGFRLDELVANTA